MTGNSASAPYEEKRGRVGLWLTLGQVATAAVLLPGAEAGDAGLLLLWLMFCSIFSIPALVSYSRRRYESIRLGPSVLTVGRDRVRVADIDSASVDEALAEADPGARQRLATSLATVDGPGLRAKSRGAPRLLGGSWGAAFLTALHRAVSR